MAAKTDRKKATSSFSLSSRPSPNFGWALGVLEKGFEKNKKQKQKQKQKQKRRKRREKKSPHLCPQTEKTNDPFQELYTCTIVTRNAAPGICSEIHERMPVILHGDEDVRAWLFHGKLNTNRPEGESPLSVHPVDFAVGNMFVFFLFIFLFFFSFFLSDQFFAGKTIAPIWPSPSLTTKKRKGLPHSSQKPQRTTKKKKKTTPVQTPHVVKNKGVRCLGEGMGQL